MRTTFRLPDELLRRLRRVALDQGVTMNDIVVTAVERAVAERPAMAMRPPLPVAEERGGLRPGIDLDDRAALDALIDDGLDVDQRR